MNISKLFFLPFFCRMQIGRYSLFPCASYFMHLKEPLASVVDLCLALI